MQQTLMSKQKILLFYQLFGEIRELETIFSVLKL